ncbi:hypothetical protein Scep_020056 [Stephania cephalantha]|uniref:Uncharacterized protein n=1 Tax=Stephania cephalantha TaxID=152367 RepID=A0AAP0NM17_9MAGN
MGLVKKMLLASFGVELDDIPATCEITLQNLKWKEVMDKEYQALMHNDTWYLVPQVLIRML